MPIQLTYAQKDGKPVVIQKTCTIEEWMKSRDRAFDDKPEEVTYAVSEADARLLTAD
jgi:hypothetical protein